MSDTFESSLNDEATIMFNPNHSIAEVYLDENGDVIEDLDSMELVDFDIGSDSPDSGASSTQTISTFILVTFSIFVTLLKHLIV